MKTFQDENDNMWEEAKPGEMVPYNGYGVLQEGWKFIKPVVKKTKWSVINTYYDPTDDHIAITLPHPINHAQIEAIKAFIEAGLEYIYADKKDIKDNLYEKAIEARRAIEEANG